VGQSVSVRSPNMLWDSLSLSVRRTCCIHLFM